MDEMLKFVEFREVSNISAYGLGVQLYPRSFSSGERAIGHSGGNIGTTTYMVYLPEHNVSIVVMINAFPNKSASYITKKLIRAVLRDLNAIGFLPYFDFFPIGLGIICFSIALTINILLYIRKKKRRQQSIT